MRLYLYIALVSLEGSLIRLFLRAYILKNVNDMYMYMLRTLCDIGFTYVHVFGLHC